MLIFGVDPGTARLGYGVIKVKKEARNGVKYVASGCLTTKLETPMGERLLYLQEEIGKLLVRYQPDVVAVEQIFFGINAKTAMAVGQARGVVLAVAAKHKVPVFEYQGLSVKVAVTGYGRSDKKQVLSGVSKILRIRRKIKPDDAADGLAVAITHHLKANAKSQTLDANTPRKLK